MSQTDLAYLAGIIDGEGCISLRRYMVGGHLRHIFHLTITNTNADLMSWVIATTGMGSIYAPKRYSDKHAQRYDWRVSATAAASLVKEILPFLIVKQKRAKLLLEFYSGRTWHGGAGRVGGRRSMPPEEFQRREKITNEFLESPGNHIQ